MSIATRLRGMALVAGLLAPVSVLAQAPALPSEQGAQEIAEAMSCPIGTVRSRIFRAREAISAKIKPLLENQSGKRW